MYRLLRVFLPAAAVLLAFAFLAPAPAPAQDEVMLLAPRDFPRPQRPAVRFPHARHADSNDCTACHHVFEQGRNVWTPGEATSCAGCHGQKSQGRAPALLPAWHHLCQDCHLRARSADKPAGPLFCGQCHVKSGG